MLSAVTSRTTAAATPESPAMIARSIWIGSLTIRRSAASDALTLATRNLTRQFLRHVGDLQLRQPNPRPVLGHSPRHAVKAERQRDVLQARQFRHQLSELEDEAEVAAAQRTARHVGHGRHRAPAVADLARVWPDDPGEAVQQRRLSGPGRPHHRDNLAGAHRSDAPASAGVCP